LERIRRHGREVAWTPDWMGIGNVLYLALWAHQGRMTGNDRRVLRSPVLTRWSVLFPGLAPLSVDREGVRLTDQRVQPWNRQPDGRPWFAWAELESLITTAGLATSVHDRAVREGKVSLDDQLTVNVRRGDYYANPAYRADFGFDVDAYLRHTIPLSLGRDGPVRRVRVVSDGIDWCRQHLGWLDDLVDEVSYAADQSPEADLLEVATSRRLVLTNSTFSYWAAYLSNAWHGEHARTWVPRFFRRTGPPTTDLDPRWTIVEDVPGGWDLKDDVG
jgi:hypothetical protein